MGIEMENIMKKSLFAFLLLPLSLTASVESSYYEESYVKQYIYAPNDIELMLDSMDLTIGHLEKILSMLYNEQTASELATLKKIYCNLIERYDEI